MDAIIEVEVPTLPLDFYNEDHSEAASLITQINHILIEIQQAQVSVDALRPLLGALLECKRSHFAREEQAMASAKYPAFHLHKQEHSRLLNEMHALIDHWNKYQDVDSVATYMRDIFPVWFTNHMNDMDSVSAEFINSR